MTKSVFQTTRQFWVSEPGVGELRQVVLPRKRENEILVRARFSGISRGTESLVFRGDVPPSQYQTMRAPFQEGDFPGPVKFGYSSVGVVEEGSDRLQGKNVFCLFPHQDRYCVPETEVFVLPDSVPESRAILAANMETAVNIFWDARPTAGDHIIVVGGGVVGLLVAYLCGDLPGSEITVIDPNPAREEVAHTLGVNYEATPMPVDGVDLVIHASGHPEGLRSALQMVGVEGTVIEASWYGKQEVSLPLGEAFHSRRLRIKSSQVGRIAPDRVPRWDRFRRLALALRLLENDRLDVLITGESRFEELPSVLSRLSGNPGDSLCHRIRYTKD